MPTRECKICKVVKPFSAYRPKEDCRDGIEPSCRDCKNAKKRATRKSRAGCPKAKAQWSKYYEENKDSLLEKRRACPKKKEYNRNRYYENPEVFRENGIRWKSENPEKVKAIQKRYRERNAPKVYAKNAKRRADKSRATPSNLSKEQLKDIESMYSLAKKLGTVFGVKYHVDHIVPLKGKNICGLHVPANLQILEASLNLAKSNKYKDT